MGARFRGPVLSTWVVAVTAATWGCGGGSAGGPPAAPPPRISELADGVRVVTAGGGLVPMPLACTPDAPERCDGVDQDCDGRIDDGCPWSLPDPAIQLTAAWVGARNLYIALSTPAMPPNPDGTTPAPLEVQRHAPEPCADASPIHVASIAIPQPTFAGDPAVPTGTWGIVVQDGGPCPEAPPGAGPPTSWATLSLAVAGDIEGVWNLDLSENGPPLGRPLLTFEVR